MSCKSVEITFSAHSVSDGLVQTESTSETPVSALLPITTVDDSKNVAGAIPSSHHTKMITSVDNQNGENFPLIVHGEQGNDIKEDSATLSSVDVSKQAESEAVCSFSETIEQITKSTIKAEHNILSTITEEEDNQKADENRAVIAPEVERPVEIDSTNVDESVCTGMHKMKALSPILCLCIIPCFRQLRK